MKINSKIIKYNIFLTTIFLILIGFIFDFIKYKRFFPETSQTRGEVTRGITSSEYYCYGLHPYLGYINACSRFDSKGFIKEHNLKKNSSLKEENVFRVLVLGGSVANHFSRKNTLEEELNKRLESSININNKYRKVEIINTALGGYKQPQQFFTIGFLLAQGYRFEAIINISGFNEIALPLAENYINQIAPILPRDHADREDKEAFLVSTYRQVKPILDLHPITRYLYPKINSFASKSFKSKKYKPYSFDLPKSRDEAFIFAKRIWIDSSNMSAAISDFYQIPYFEFIQPNQYVKSSKIFTEKELSENILSYEIIPYRKPIEDFYLEINVKDFSIPNNRIIDLRYLFENEKKDIYSDACCHFNDYGNKLISKEISNIIFDYFDEL